MKNLPEITLVRALQIIEDAQMTQNIDIDFEMMYNCDNSDIKELQALVKYNGLTIKWIKNQNKNIQLAAINQNLNSFQYIKNPYPEVIQIIRLAKIKEKLEKLV